MKIESISFAQNRIRIKGDIVYNKRFINLFEELFGKKNVSVNYKVKSIKIESKEIIDLDELQRKLKEQEILPLGERICLTDFHPFISRIIRSDTMKLLLYTIDYGARIGLIRFLWANILFNKVILNFV